MAVITYLGTDYTVDHAVKGADYIHGYDANSVLIVSFEGISDFSLFSYNGTYMTPDHCLAEGCNDVKFADGTLKKRDGTPISPSDYGAVSKTGDTMTGPLVIQGASTVLNLVNTDKGRSTTLFVDKESDGDSYLRNRKDDNNMTTLVLKPETADLAKTVRLLRRVGGTLSGYDIYGEHNKPTYSDVGAVKITQLWRNASYNSSFAAQTLSLGLADYDMYIVTYRYSTETGAAKSTISKCGNSVRMDGTESTSAMSAKQCVRTATYDAGSLAFSDCTQGGSTANDMLIPIYIYGIKGVQS